MGLASVTAASQAEAPAGKGDVPAQAPTPVRAWAERSARMCRPDRIVWIDGSAVQRQNLIEDGIASGIFIRLNQTKRPNCYLHRSNPNDVARTEQLTFICTPSEDMAGPTNNWMESKAAYAKLRGLFDGCMVGRTMYVVPFVMGPIGSRLAKVGMQITDSIYVAVSMQLMTRAGNVAWGELLRMNNGGDEFTRCLHSLGDVDPARRYICHFPLDNVIWSFGSGYGGNALLGKKSLALRIASFMGSQQEWMAEHMLCLAATDPAGRKKYVAAAFPSASGKTNFAMLIPPERYRKEGWKITTVGDDIVWMWVDVATGKLRAINPEAGYFGVVPGTNEQTNPNAVATMSHDTIFTNVALLPDGDVWWEGKTPDPPAQCTDWRGQPWTPASPSPAAHPNSRFTAPMTNNPALDPSADDPAGVPISAIIFGGRRTRDIPLVYQAFNWIHGVYVGATLASETTAAATGQLGIVRRDPMAMLPFLGYNIRDYMVHWFRMRKKMADCPRIFHVNWFRKDDHGKFIWPGFGDNMRVLKWILDRCAGRAYAVETPLGWMPRPEDIDLADSTVTLEQLRQIQTIDLDAVRRELLNQEELFLKLAGDLPKEMIFQRELLISRL
jgi:phosphoenolpyruvate carboxykinase (GTP)